MSEASPLHAGVRPFSDDTKDVGQAVVEPLERFGGLESHRLTDLVGGWNVAVESPEGSEVVQQSFFGRWALDREDPGWERMNQLLECSG